MKETYLVACAGTQTYIINAESKEKAITEANKISYWSYGVELQHPTAYLIKDYVGDDILDVSEMEGIPDFQRAEIDKRYEGSRLMNFLQKMMYEALCNDMEVALFNSHSEIKREVNNTDIDTVRAFFEDYTTDEILDIIEQTIENEE